MARKTIAERIQEEQIAVFNAVYELDREGGDNELIEVSEMDKARIGEILQRTFWCFNHLYTQGKSMGEAAADGKVCGDGAGVNVRELSQEQKKALTDQRRELSFKTLDEARAALKAVRNFEDFKEFEFRLENCTGYFHHVELDTKRTGSDVQAFTIYQHNPAKCRYLINNGGVGVSRWENLHRVIEVRIDWVKP